MDSTILTETFSGFFPEYYLPFSQRFPRFTGTLSECLAILKVYRLPLGGASCSYILAFHSYKGPYTGSSRNADETLPRVTQHVCKNLQLLATPFDQIFT